MLAIANCTCSFSHLLFIIRKCAIHDRVLSVRRRDAHRYFVACSHALD